MLHDIDKSGEDRSAPRPNAIDVTPFSAAKSHGTESINFTTDATSPVAINEAHNGKFTIAKADTFTYPNSINTNSPGGAGNFATTDILLGTIPHNLPFVPGIIAYYNGAHGWWRLPFNDTLTIFTTAWWYSLSAEVDATNVYFYFRSMNAVGSTGLSGGANFKYYLLRQTTT